MFTLRVGHSDAGISTVALCLLLVAAGCIKAEPFVGGDTQASSSDAADAETGTDVAPDAADTETTPDDTPTPPQCEDGSELQHCDCDEEGVWGGAEDALVCFGGSWCLPSCESDCGDDGCGGECDLCGAGAYCDEGSCADCQDGIENCPCEIEGEVSGEDDDLVCFEGTWCYPWCEPDSCDDTCGGDCGGCKLGLACEEDGMCEGIDCTPGTTLCGEGEGQTNLLYECNEDGSGALEGAEVIDCTDEGDQWQCISAGPQGECQCVADCEEKSCGDDGCSGACGSCADGFFCLEGSCEAQVCDPEQKYCLGDTALVCNEDGSGPTPSVVNCSSLEKICEEGVCVCVPDCGAKSCGDDGCGGECGTCSSNELCDEDGGLEGQAGICVDQQCDPGKPTCVPGDTTNAYICLTGVYPDPEQSDPSEDCSEVPGGKTCLISYGEGGDILGECHCGQAGTSWCTGDGGPEVPKTEVMTCTGDGSLALIDCNEADHPWCQDGECFPPACGPNGVPCEGQPCSSDAVMTYCVTNQGLSQAHLECEEGDDGWVWMTHSCGGGGVTCNVETGDCVGGGNGGACVEGGPCEGDSCNSGQSSMCADWNVKLFCDQGEWQAQECIGSNICTSGACGPSGQDGCTGGCAGGQMCFDKFNGQDGEYACYSCSTFCNNFDMCGEIEGKFGIGSCSCTEAGGYEVCDADEVCNSDHQCVPSDPPDAECSVSGLVCEGDGCDPPGDTYVCLPDGGLLYCDSTYSPIVWTLGSCNAGETCTSGACVDTGGGGDDEACMPSEDLAMEVCESMDCCTGSTCKKAGVWCASVTTMLYCPGDGSALESSPCTGTSMCTDGGCI